jgi:hypothetical protein
MPYIPHLTMLWHTVSPHEVQFWYDYDLYWLRCCDGLYRIPGESTGADGEVAQAEADGQPVFNSMDDIPQANGEPSELLEGFEHFTRVCRARLRMGAAQYGEDWKTKDNIAEAKAETHDLANYAFLHSMQLEEWERGDK